MAIAKKAPATAETKDDLKSFREKNPKASGPTEVPPRWVTNNRHEKKFLDGPHEGERSLEERKGKTRTFSIFYGLVEDSENPNGKVIFALVRKK